MKKLNVLEKLKQKEEYIEGMKEVDPLMKMEYGKDILDKIAGYMVAANQKQNENNRQKNEKIERNLIKNSIFEKAVIDFEGNIIDFNFIPIIPPQRSNTDVVALAFAFNDLRTKIGTIVITDMKGRKVVETKVENWTIQYILPNVNPNDLFLGAYCSDSMNLHLITLSTDPYIGAEKESSNIPYMRIVSSNYINLPTKIKDLEDGDKVDQNLIIQKATSYVIQSNKYFMFIDNQGNAITVRGDLKVKNVFPLETSSITSLRRHNLSLLFSTENNIGFMKIFEETSDQIYCEGGTAKIISVAGDYLTPNSIYAYSQETNEFNQTFRNVVLFEIRQSSNRVAAEECRIIGKVKINIRDINDKYSFTNLRGFITLVNDLGEVEIFKSLNIHSLVNDPISYVYKPFEKYNNGTLLSSEEILKIKQDLRIQNSDIRDVRSNQGTYVMVRNPQNLKQIAFTEFIKLDEAGKIIKINIIRYWIYYNNQEIYLHSFTIERYYLFTS